MDGMKKKAFLLLTMFLTAVFVLSGGIGGTYAEASETSAAEISGTLVRESDGYYYYYIDGVKQTGWQTITQDGVENTYYFFGTAGSQPAGSAAVGLQLIGSYRYYFSNEGVMQTGWKTISGKKYYFYKETEAQPVGTAAVGLRLIGKYRYYFSSEGVMQTGWQTINGKKYYFVKTKTKSTYGQALVGLKKIGNYRYYFSSTGVMQTGKKKISGSLYYFKSNGRARTGWFTVGSKLYYANSNGKLKKNTTYQSVTFTKNGYAKSNTASKLKIKCMKIVSSITTSSMTKAQKLKACWNYMTNRSRWSYRTIYLSSYTSGWQRTVAYNMLTSGSGNCYSFACAFAALAHEVGYTPYVVVGRVSGTRDGASDGLTRHCWVKINGCYYDPEAYFAGWWTGCYGVSTYSIRHTIIGTYKFI
ncbi:MAG: hypothetical protein LUG56_05605 [Lachnospiraceae bacterium]|nr:hypothetical protein [Lachnospiraceae bacterium]